MEIHCDLHAHSAYAGGARAGGKTTAEQSKRIRKRFEDAAKNSPLKGVNLIGTGDAQFEPWMRFLKDNLEEVDAGIFQYTNTQHYDVASDTEPPRYMLQSEIIITGPVVGTGKKKKAHVIVYFPDFSRIEEFNELLDKFGVARKNMARPFMVCDSIEDVDERYNEILDLDKMMELVPAHVLTPEGIYGSNVRINRMEEFFGSAASRVNAIETGLSADPDILGLIPELDKITLISNADAHSAALNRVGREFTSLDSNQFSYNGIINAIRKNHVLKTAEFHPTEGRYFLTGHRENRKKPSIHAAGEYCYFSPKYVPDDDICPICFKPLTVGVIQRAFEISHQQNDGIARKIGEGPKRNFVTMVPLVEIIASSLNLKSLTSKKVLKMYSEVIDLTDTEVNLWTNDKIGKILAQSKLPEQLIQNIHTIKTGDFSFQPVGYDGLYGQLHIGKTQDYEEIKNISR